MACYDRIQGRFWSAGSSYVRRLAPDLIAVGIGAMLVLAAWSRVWCCGTLFKGGSDNAGLWPTWSFVVSELQRGELPLWDPFTVGGHSMVGEGQQGTLYPPLLLTAWLFGIRALTAKAYLAFTVAHALLALMGGYVLGRALRLGSLGALAVGITFSLSGFATIGALAHMNVFLANSWVPLILAGPLLAAWRGRLAWVLLSAIAIAMSLLAGYPQPAFHASILLVAIVLGLTLTKTPTGARVLSPARALGAVIIAGSLAFALAAPQIMASLEYTPRAIRWSGAPHPFPANMAVPFGVVALNPHLTWGEIGGLLWRQAGINETEVLVGGAGAVAIMVAVFARWRRAMPWLTLAMLGLILALGPETPVLKLLYTGLFPIIDRISEPVRYLLLIQIGAAVLIGIGVDTITIRQKAPRSHWVQTAAAATLIAAALVLSLSPAGSGTGLGGTVVYDSLMLGLALSVILLWRLVIVSGPLAAILVTALLGLELASGWFYRIPMRVRSPDLPQAIAHSDLLDWTAGFLANHPGSYRIDHASSALPPNTGQVLRVKTTNGYGATRPTAFYELQDTLGYLPPSVGANLLGIRYVFSTRALPGLQMIAQHGDVGVYENVHALPLAWFAERVAAESSEQSVIELMAAPGYDPSREAVVLGQPPIRGLGSKPAGSWRVDPATETPQRIEIPVSTDSTRLLVVSEPYYPGWTATVDDKPVPIVPTDLALTGVEIPPGAHRLVLAYRPWSIRAGIGMAAAGMAFGAGIMMLGPLGGAAYARRRFGPVIHGPRTRRER
jgi:hypothetical protein